MLLAISTCAFLVQGHTLWFYSTTVTILEETMVIMLKGTVLYVFFIHFVMQRQTDSFKIFSACGHFNNVLKLYSGPWTAHLVPPEDLLPRK